MAGSACEGRLSDDMAEIGRITVFGFATSQRSLTVKSDVRVSSGLRPQIVWTACLL